MDHIWLLLVKRESGIEIIAYYNGENAWKHYSSLEKGKRRLLRLDTKNNLSLVITRDTNVT